MCSVVAQVEGERVRVLDEIVLSRASTQDACEEFERAVSGACGGLVVYADATGARMQTTGTTDVAILREFFRSGEYGDVEFQDSEVESGGAGSGDADEREAGSRPTGSGR